MRLCYGITVLLLGILEISYGSPPKINARVNIDEEKRTDQPVAEVSQIISNGRAHRISPVYQLMSQKLLTSSPHLATQSSRSGEWLQINRTTGTITFVQKFDRDVECPNSEQCVISTQVIVKPQRILKIIELEIVIDDINDNEPIFPVSKLLLNVSESAAINDVINLDAYQATDADSGRNAYLRYSVSTNPYFRIKHYIDDRNSSHLKLQVTEKPNHEKTPSLNLNIWAFDAGAPAKMGEMTVQVNIIDTNDNYPIFEKNQYTVTVEENAPAGTTLAVVKANDADSGIFGRILYTISTRNHPAVRRLAHIDRQRGTVWIGEPLDREKHKGLQILIEAHDSDPHSPKSGETLLTIHVKDVNDNTPTIDVEFISHSESDTVYIPESTPIGSYIAKVTVRDADGGKNGETETTVSSIPQGKRVGKAVKDHRGAYFNLTNGGFLATNYEFDREACSRYSMLIQACDHGVPARCERKQITVVILDVNEYAPTVKKNLIQVSLSEDVYEGTKVAMVQSTDGDSKNGYAFSMNETGHIVKSRNGDITYAIREGNNGPFTIDKKTGQIRVMSQLDREKKAEWKLTISVRDGGIPPKESFCTVIVTVEDVNDNAPIFVNPSVNNTLIYADIGSNKVITKIEARDFDEGDNGKVLYFIIPPKFSGRKSRHRQFVSNNETNVNSYFILNPVTGDLRLNFTKGNLSNAIGIHNILIRAKDSGSISLSAEMAVRVAVGEYGKGRMNPREDDIKSSSINFLILAISLGCATAVLIFLIIYIVIRCRRINREISSLSKTAATRKSESAEEKKSEVTVTVKNNNNDKPTPVQSKKKMKNDVTCPNKKVTQDAEHSLRVPPNSLTVDGAGGHGTNDNDSGKGESDIEAASLLVNDSKVCNQREELGSKCTDDCRLYGHSDECWMPTEEEDIAPLATSDVSKPCSLKSYDWEKLKPRYLSPEHEPARKGSRYSYASTTNTDNGSYASTSNSHRSINDEKLFYKPRHHSASRVADIQRGVPYETSPQMPYAVLPFGYTNPANNQPNPASQCHYMDAVYEVNYSVQASGRYPAYGPYPRSQTPNLLGSHRTPNVPFNYLQSGIPQSNSAHCEISNLSSSRYPDQPKVSMQEAREVFDGINGLVV